MYRDKEKMKEQVKEKAKMKRHEDSATDRQYRQVVTKNNIPVSGRN